mgnify:CR=1 FL=1
MSGYHLEKKHNYPFSVIRTPRHGAKVAQDGILIEPYLFIQR